MRFDRDRQGRLERGRGDGDPFQGDPIDELVEECADACNYADEAFSQSMFELWRFRAIDYHLRQAAWLALGARADAEGEDS